MRHFSRVKRAYKKTNKQTIKGTKWTTKVFVNLKFLPKFGAVLWQCNNKNSNKNSNKNTNKNKNNNKNKNKNKNKNSNKNSNYLCGTPFTDLVFSHLQNMNMRKTTRIIKSNYKFYIDRPKNQDKMCYENTWKLPLSNYLKFNQGLPGGFKQTVPAPPPPPLELLWTGRGRGGSCWRVLLKMLTRRACSDDYEYYSNRSSIYSNKERSNLTLTCKP